VTGSQKKLAPGPLPPQSASCAHGVTHTELLSMTTGRHSIDAQSESIVQSDPSDRPGFGVPPAPPVPDEVVGLDEVVVLDVAPPVPPPEPVVDDELVVPPDVVVEEEVVPAPPVPPAPSVVAAPPAAHPRPHVPARAHAATAVIPSQEAMRIRRA
jgi:hypothetical protein